MSSYALTLRAEEHIADIQIYTIENFGANQARRYLLSLTDCFELLSTQPRLGRIASRIGPTVRRHEHGSHVILYEIVDGGILILAVIHQQNLSELDI